MPELPDLTVFAKNLRRELVGKEITSAEVFTKSKVNATSKALREALVGSSIAAINREGKELFFTAANGHVLATHLMLSGKFTICTIADVHATFNKVVVLTFADDRALILADYLHRAKVTLDPKPSGGPDVLSAAFTFDYFAKALAKHGNLSIKALLIDQKILKGIGNAYADEILYAANISPKSIAGKIPPEVAEELYEAIPRVLQDAVTQIEAISPDIIGGEERSFLKVHNHKLTHTETGEEICKSDVDGKDTYYTKKQRFYL